ncbi:uncharacterized protein LOC122069782 [Macadamia integrifolia]|uniref:uncharacterized protein LOC122069782 n=1 Tax=Macadamia integrifolia TaxID=60698 RepID=UPI001C4F4491|nr:uncharacterized protein LOC122069782 [Macadamia integrifolia]
MTEFLPQQIRHTSVLHQLLKKKAPPWSSEHSAAIQALKQLSTKLPYLQIPSDGRRILQTDASDTHWGVVLLEEAHDAKRTICGYKSGSFKPSEAHYHSTFKEILAVRRGIEKFQFHLIGHIFLIELDMSSFPRMLEFRQRTLPNDQLLQWAQWSYLLSLSVSSGTYVQPTP